LCFQVADDILDVTAATEQLGKTSGKDQQQGKLTYPSLVGLDESKKIAEQLTRQAVDSLSCFNSRAELLRQLAQRMLNRKS
jgi:geranylgeranyl pyrophosphate synthase